MSSHSHRRGTTIFFFLSFSFTFEYKYTIVYFWQIIQGGKKNVDCSAKILLAHLIKKFKASSPFPGITFEIFHPVIVNFFMQLNVYSFGVGRK